jgi:type I restriction-modification system DNA methylase subunit
VASEPKTPELSRHDAATFADKWKSYTDEKQHGRGFWSDFFRALCGVADQEVAGIEYEKRVKSTISGNQEYIDVYWKNVALIEHKSTGENLDKAELQARGYWLSLPPGYRPKTIIISDFQNFRLIDVALNRTHNFPLSQLPENIHRFEAIISGNRTRISDEEITVDQQAAKLMANLYLELEDHGFEGHETSIFLIRILFLLFGDDTGMWEKNLFLKLVMDTKDDGSDVGLKIDTLFDVLNTQLDKRPKELREEFQSFPYVNGGIFAEKISVIDFNNKMRKALVEVANYDWTTINPTIFGSLFQLVKNKEARRELGEHYTSEENINKIVYPLFLDELQERLAGAWDNKKELKKLRQDLTKIKIFDPACGCGNFLVVSYRHLRQLELELIARLNHLEGSQYSMQIDGSMGLSITLNQFYGIEIEEWPAQVARMALFLTDHQENLKLERITGATPNRFPIKDFANIFNANALQCDWNDFLEIDSNTYILGNPPFIGMYLMTEEQQQDRNSTFLDFNEESSRTGRLDYVTSWYAKSISTVKGKNSKCAFVSTNSITQGEQARTLGPLFANTGFEIDFAFPTFYWTSDSSNAAAVHVVIIGFSEIAIDKKKTLHFVNDDNGNVNVKSAKHINFYLIDGPEIELVKRKSPIVNGLPDCSKGSQPTDGGNLFFKGKELDEARKDPIANAYLKRFIGATELLYDEERYCLWLVDAKPQELHKSSLIKKRLEAVASMRRESPTKSVQEQANTPSLFTQIRQPKGPYFALPCVSSERREYIPGAFFDENSIAGNGVLTFPNAPLWLFGYLQSKAFTEWVATFSGRLKSDFQIHPAIVYFTFPFIIPDASQRLEIELLSRGVLDARSENIGASLANLYDPLTMPSNLRKAHNALDKCVDGMYSKSRNTNSAERLNLLMEKYKEILENERLV